MTITPRTRVSFCLALALCATTVIHVSVAGQQGAGQGQGQAQTQGGRGQGGRGQGAPGAAGGAAAAPTPDVVPTSAASLVAHPEFYLGKVITISGSLERQVSATVFTLGQNGPALGEVLVIAPSLTTKPAARAYLTVIGDAFAFEPADAAKRNKGTAVDVPANIAEMFKGKPAILATAVVGADFTDLTKRKAAPMTADDEKLSALMKQISPAATALRSAGTANDFTAKAARTAELKKLFADVQAVFTARAITTAVTWSNDALKALDAGDTAALTQTCSACHNAHRERQDDGTYRLKLGGR